MLNPEDIVKMWKDLLSHPDPGDDEIYGDYLHDLYTNIGKEIEKIAQIRKRVPRAFRNYPELVKQFEIINNKN